MNIQDLTYFKHLAESLSFTTTAEHFFVSQPSISMALKRLEEELDAKLIDRRKSIRRMKLTPAGDILYKSASDVLGILESTKQTIKDARSETIYFGYLPTIGSRFLPIYLAEIGENAKLLRLVEEESSDAMYKMVQQEKVPLAIVGHDSQRLDDPHIDQFPITAHPISLWVAPNHPFASREYVTIEEAQESVFISLSEGYSHQRIFEKWATDNQIPKRNIIYAKEIKTLLTIAQSTDFIAFMSEILLSPDTPLVKVQIENAPKFYISLIINNHRENSLSQQDFNEKVIALTQKNLMEPEAFLAD